VRVGIENSKPTIRLGRRLIELEPGEHDAMRLVWPPRTQAYQRAKPFRYPPVSAAAFVPTELRSGPLF
jgi:hypothetical protein